MTLNLWREFPGPNTAYLLELFGQYEQDPGLLDETTQTFFEQHEHAIRQMIAGGGQAAVITAVSLEKLRQFNQSLLAALPDGFQHCLPHDGKRPFWLKIRCL